jgi:hypothetical protein
MSIETCPFHEGDSICLVKGSYQGTIGIFLHLQKDPLWAELCEPGGLVRAHPVEWMALAGPPAKSTPASRG